MSKLSEKIVRDAFDARIAQRLAVISPAGARQSSSLKLWDDIDIDYFQQLPSTSQYLKEQSSLKNTDSDTDRLAGNRSRVCIAARQTSGVGRRGNPWYSSENCITFSILAILDIPPASLGGLSLATGVAVAETLGDLCCTGLTLKWPNDVLAGRAKLCGILTEIPQSSRQRAAVVTGIGVNYVSDSHVHGKVDRSIATLQELTSADQQTPCQLPGREVVAGQLAADVLLAHQLFVDSGWQAFADRFATLDALANQRVSVSQDGSVHDGIAVGVAADGRLKVDIGGTVQCFAAGDVTLSRDLPAKTLTAKASTPQDTGMVITAIKSAGKSAGF